jgi:hypothetical protein
MRRFLTSLALAGGTLGGVALWRRSRAEARERLDLYFEDGSMVSFDASSSQAERLMPLARRVLAAARG